MFHDLRERISRTRRIMAWSLLILLLVLAAFEQSIQREPQVLERLVDLMEARARSAGPQTAEKAGLRREQWLAQIKGRFGL